MNKNSILAETLAEIQELKEAVQKNANHALKSTLKEDLEAIVKNGLKESDEDNLNTDDMGGDAMPADLDGEGDVESDELTMTDEPSMEPEMDLDSEMGADIETIDLTDKPEDEVINHFDLMDPADEIEIVKTDDGISINIKTSNDEPEMGGDEPAMEPEMGDDELGVDPEMGGDEPAMEPEMGGDEPAMEPEMGDDENPEDDEDDKIMEENEGDIVYEIEIDEVEHAAEHEEPVLGNKTGMSGTGNHDHEVHEGETKEHEEPVLGNKTGMSGTGNHDHEVKENKNTTKEKELHESLINTRKKLSQLVAENKNKTEELEKTTKLVEEFKKSESDYKTAIKSLKTQLQEVALFTSNLTYAIKLMTENSTTKDEKLDILKRFDTANTLSESREIFNTLETSFKKSKTTTEKTIEEKVLTSQKTSGASNLNESTAYQNPQLSRMLDIIGKIQ